MNTGKYQYIALQATVLAIGIWNGSVQAIDRSGADDTDENHGRIARSSDAPESPLETTHNRGEREFNEEGNSIFSSVLKIAVKIPYLSTKTRVELKRKMFVGNWDTLFDNIDIETFSNLAYKIYEEILDRLNTLLEELHSLGQSR